jgi:hypothetical protein
VSGQTFCSLRYAQHCRTRWTQPAKITTPPLGPSGGYTLLERRRRCVQHFCSVAKRPRLVAPTLLICGAPSGGPLLPTAAMARSKGLLATNVDFFDPDAVYTRCIPWVLDLFCFLQDCPVLSVLRGTPLVPFIVMLVCLGLLWRMKQYPWVSMCSHLGWCIDLYGLLHCHLSPVLLGAAPHRSAPLGLLRPKPLRSPLVPDLCSHF